MTDEVTTNADATAKRTGSTPRLAAGGQADACTAQALGIHEPLGMTPLEASDVFWIVLDVLHRFARSELRSMDEHGRAAVDEFVTSYPPVRQNEDSDQDAFDRVEAAAVRAWNVLADRAVDANALRVERGDDRRAAADPASVLEKVGPTADPRLVALLRAAASVFPKRTKRGKARRRASMRKRNALPVKAARTAMARSTGMTDEQSKTLLARTPALIRDAKASASRAAVAFDAVHKGKLFTLAGYATMLAYAQKELGLRGRASFDFYSRSGAGARQYYPKAYAALLTEILEGGSNDPESTRDGRAARPPIPEVTALSMLPKLMKVVPEGDRDDVLKKLATGKMTTRDVKALIAQTAPSSTEASSAPAKASEMPNDADAPGPKPDERLPVAFTAFTAGEQLAGMQDVLWALNAVGSFVRASGASLTTAQLDRVRDDVRHLDELLANLINAAGATS